jgi:AcrR family transcriptional regulator
MATGVVTDFKHGRVPREVRRAHVLGLAEALFAEKGYTAASMDELARRAGVSKPMIYELVGSKDEVFKACMDKAADELEAAVREAVAGAPPGRDQLLAGSRAWFRYIDDRRDLWLALLASTDAPISAQVDAIRRRQTRVVASFVADNLGGFDGLPPAAARLLDAIATAAIGTFEALGRWWSEHPEVTIDALAELCADALLPSALALAVKPPKGWDA